MGAAAARQCTVLDRPTLVLASGSPRRRALLEAVGLVFDMVSPALDESALSGEPPEEMVVRLARAKTEKVAQQVPPGTHVLGLDTTVALDGEAVGKPADAADAVSILRRLGGRTHDVHTGHALAVAGGRMIGVDVTTSRVTMAPISVAEAEGYVATGEPLDKAGAYAIQGRGVRFVTSVVGSRTNVMGLPREIILPLLRTAGFNIEEVDNHGSR